MTRKQLFLPQAFSLLLLVAFFTLSHSARADLETDETALEQEDGNAKEINLDHQGLLWVSDAGAGELRAYNPTTEVYTTYLGLGAPSDGRRSPDGTVWWIDPVSDQLAQLELDASDITYWNLPTTSPYGTAVDSSGTVWVTEYFEPDLYRFDPASSQLCIYNYGDPDGASDYVLAQGDYIWLGDWINDAIHRLQISSGVLTTWELTYFNPRPVGLAIDDRGNLWWADSSRGVLGRLEPALDRISIYEPPAGAGGTPEMVTSSGKRIWYSDDYSGQVGRLDPSLATPKSSYTTSPNQTPLISSCSTISPADSGTATSTSNNTTWSMVIYTTTIDSGGWLIVKLPPDAYPWGITALKEQAWFLDYNRQVLSRILGDPSVTACKLADTDGSLDTTNDQAPIAGWTVMLYANDVVTDTQLTGADGCYTWYDLEPGIIYRVVEEVPTGWRALTPTSHDFGVGKMGEIYEYTFINAESVQVTACKLADADGELATNGDQQPVQDWPVSLWVDSVEVDVQTTGSDGCYTWDDQLPGHTYAVEEDLLSGWQALTPTSHDFGEVSPGEQVSHTFINAQVAQEDGQKIYLPLVTR
jgi:streptogramin lyase